MHLSEVGRLEKAARKLAAAKEWEFVELLGHGASAAVFEVSTSQGPAALKIYHPNFLRGNEGVVSRARLALVQEKLMSHTCPTLVRVFDCGEADGTVYMLMERVPGLCLTEALKLVPGDKIETIVTQVAQAAEYLETLNICHRDIKPDNVVVSADFKQATLLDLGVVRLIDSAEGSGTDDSGQLPFVATARYSSPEYMFRLWPPGPELWRALTFYQLGAIIHDLLAGEQLFDAIVKQGAGNRYLIAHAVATTHPSVPVRTDAPSYLVVLAQRALQKDPAARLQAVTWEDFKQDRRIQNELLLGVRKTRNATSIPSFSNYNDLANKIRDHINRKLTENKIDCIHKIEFRGRNEFLVKFEWSADLPNIFSALPIRSCIRILIKEHLATISGSASCEGTVTVNTSCVTVPYTAGNEAAVEEQCYASFLEASASVARNNLKENEEHAI
ncbi:protein kinase domain-containing protein [Pseudorhizobium pelagicum]|uniref:protein kinase domain-containing protein n=1 Tax=Pseudorhizobium pelagicum TaxID=1509405 RepID=UPI000691800C|nr:protein kinase [Pseudorhizobium pelagicum]